MMPIRVRYTTRYTLRALFSKSHTFTDTDVQSRTKYNKIADQLRARDDKK